MALTFKLVCCPKCGYKRAYITEGRIYSFYLHCPNCGYTKRLRGDC